MESPARGARPRHFKGFFAMRPTAVSKFFSDDPG
jgi:hypothetical protein